MKFEGKVILSAWACHNKNYGSGQISENILRKLFNNVITFDPQEIMYNYGKEEMNSRFLALIEKEKPDFIFFWMIYDEFYTELFIKIREVSPSSILLNFFGDDDTLFYSYSRYYALFFDYNLIFQRNFLKEYKKEGINNVFITNGVDTDKYKPLGLKKEIDVSFIGTPKSDRYEMIKYLIDKGINVNMFGAGWEKYPELKEYYKGKLTNEELVKVINKSKINICLTKNYEGILHFKGRTVEIAACKAFSLGELFDGYYEMFEKGKEIVMFKDKEDLLKKAKYYLKNDKEREKIAEASYKRVLKEFSLEKETEEIFKIAMKNKSIKKDIMPKIKGKSITLRDEDFNGGKKELVKKTDGFDYISFLAKGAKFGPFKEIFQIYSLQMSGKKISCCDYHVNSTSLGDYLTFQTKYSYGILKKDEFSRLLNIGQLMIDKKYFFDNIEKFKSYFKGNDIDIIDEKNTVFVSMPLLSIKEINHINFDKMNKAFLPKYEDALRFYQNNNRLYANSYIYKLLLYSFFNRKFIIRNLQNKFNANSKLAKVFFIGRKRN